MTDLSLKTRIENALFAEERKHSVDGVTSWTVRIPVAEEDRDEWDYICDDFDEYHYDWGFEGDELVISYTTEPDYDFYDEKVIEMVLKEAHFSASEAKRLIRLGRVYVETPHDFVLEWKEHYNKETWLHDNPAADEEDYAEELENFFFSLGVSDWEDLEEKLMNAELGLMWNGASENIKFDNIPVVICAEL